LSKCACEGLDPSCPFGAQHFTKDVLRLAAHRPVPAWVMKLVGEMVALEREACAKVADEWVEAYPHPSKVIGEKIRARGTP
jgi:hypothetical protein